MTTVGDLEQRITALEREIYDGEQQRKPLYWERRDAEDEAYKTRCSAEIDRQTAALWENGRSLLCAAGYWRMCLWYPNRCSRPKKNGRRI